MVAKLQVADNQFFLIWKTKLQHACQMRAALKYWVRMWF
jgi:hypothetical protein